MVMAELVRQAEGACAESGHVLAATWNLHLGLADAMTGADASSAAHRNVQTFTTLRSLLAQSWHEVVERRALHLCLHARVEGVCV